MSITLELPDVVKEQLGESPEALTRALIEKAAAEGYRSGRLTRAQIRELLGLSWHENEAFLARNGCYRDHPPDDLAWEQKSIEYFQNRR